VNPEASLALGLIFGIVGGTMILATLGLWGLPLVLLCTLLGIVVGDRL
jgi:hypothetical protein